MIKQKKIYFPDILNQKKESVWQEIKKYLNLLVSYPKFCDVPKKYYDLVDFHKEIVSDYPKRQGKYVRPSLVLLTAGAMGFSEKKAIKTAAAMQISEEWILNHDDIEDNSLERRGKPCLHRIYGEELAINAGDGLHILMWKVLIGNKETIGVKKTFAVMEEFFKMLNRTVFGQGVESKWILENKTDLTDEDVLLILESKTGYYTIAGPMRLGAILAGASERQLNKIYEFGKPLGYCYQIRDDLLDLTSDFSGLKKQQGNDIYEGKRTIMLAHLLRVLKSNDRDKLLKILKKTREKKKKEEVFWVIEKMKDYGSLDYAKVLVEKYAAEAKIYFRKNLGFLKKEPFRSQLLAGIDFIVKREY